MPRQMHFHDVTRLREEMLELPLYKKRVESQDLARLRFGNRLLHEPVHRRSLMLIVIALRDQMQHALIVV